MVLALGSLSQLTGNLTEQVAHVVAEFDEVRGTDGSRSSGLGGSTSSPGRSTFHRCTICHAIYHGSLIPSYSGRHMHLLFMDTDHGLDTSSGDRDQHINPSMVIIKFLIDMVINL